MENEDRFKERPLWLVTFKDGTPHQIFEDNIGQLIAKAKADPNTKSITFPDGSVFDNVLIGKVQRFMRSQLISMGY